MRPKEKSIRDVLRQLDRIQQEYRNSQLMNIAYQIAQYYISMIEDAQKTWGDDKRFSITVLDSTKYDYRIRSYVYDTKPSQIRELQPCHLEGLWFDFNGERLTPHNLYFSSDVRIFRDDDRCGSGKCYAQYACALRPVYLPSGQQYYRRDLACVSARYKDGWVCEYYRE